MNVLVVGDEASLASKIAARLNARGHDAVAPHIPSAACLETAELADVLSGAASVIDVASPPSYDSRDAWECFTSAAGNLLSAARSAGVAQVVALSVVGTGRLLSSGYFRAKALQEELIRESGLPFTIVRAHNDDRRVLGDPRSRFLGARVDDQLLLPSRGAALYLTDYSDWLALNTLAAVH
jgi:nucleoside-diphosphate-sugar epimerase